MKLRRVFTTVTIVALAGAGCTSVDAHSTGDAQHPNTPQGSQLCELIGIDSTGPEFKEWMFTAIRRVEPGMALSPGSPEVDKPITARVEWEGDRVDEGAATAVEESTGYFTAGTAPTIADVDRMVSGSRESGQYVVYAGAEAVSLPLKALCSDGSAVEGNLFTWTDSEIGLVLCATVYKKGTAPPAALRAQKEFCI